MITTHQQSFIRSEMSDVTLSNSTATGSPPTNPTIEPYTTDLNGVDQPTNNVSRDVLFWSLGILAMIVLAFRLWELGWHHMRHLFGLNATEKQQSYFATNRSTWWPWIKKHIIFAPLWKNRHNREIRLSSAVNVGTLPSRFHTVLLGFLFFSNLIFCLKLDYNDQNRYAVLADLRGRTGMLSAANMLVLVILAARNNPLIGLLRISFDTYNLLHRWIGRIAVVETLIHTLAWTIAEVASSGWTGVGYKIGNDPFIGYGTVGVVAMFLILISSPSIFRHAFYETFLNVHIISVLVMVVGIWRHYDIARLPQLPLIKGFFALWFCERATRVARAVWYNYRPKAGYTRATVEVIPAEACRVTLHLPTHISVKPGSHAYLRFPFIKWWDSHPFSIAWTKDNIIDPELPTVEKSSDSTVKRSKMTTDVSFIIHVQTGWTRHLYVRALKACPQLLSTPAIFEGPYQGNHSLDSYGTLLLFAGSSGISHQMPFLKHLICAHEAGTVATRRITLVWIIRDIETLEWVRPWMTEILALRSRKEVLKIKMFVTRPNNPREISSPSAQVQMFPGRPNVKTLMETAVKERVGAMCVTVCGPGSLADNVRAAVRDVQEVGVVDFIEESFTW